MIVLKENILPQTIKFVPRTDLSSITLLTQIILIDQQTDVQVFIQAVFTTNLAWYGECQFTDTNSFLKRGHTYILKILQPNNEEVYHDTCFVIGANESISTYYINNNNYVSHSTNNTFIVYE